MAIERGFQSMRIALAQLNPTIGDVGGNVGPADAHCLAGWVGFAGIV
ncbi:MAG: hypothetical protein K6T80_06140 [Firmicutes bacterium]|nr:hypothetical protein [Bacillota bacterium]